ncbi:unnamed protein product, partial [marine sediment metagenome]
RLEAGLTAVEAVRKSDADPVQDEKLEDLQEEIVAMRLNEHNDIRDDAIVHEMVKENVRMIQFQYERMDERLKREIVVHDKIRGRLEARIHGLESHVFTSHPQMKHLHLDPSHLPHGSE